MKEQILAELGLTKNEAKVYVSLLEIGSASPTQIADASGIHRVNVYDTVNKLKERGLVGESIIKGKKNYQAANPEVLKNLLKEKEIQLEKILPQLMLSSRLAKNPTEVQVFEGNDFIRNLFLHFLELKEDIYITHVPKSIIDTIGEYFQNEIHKRRALNKQSMFHIYNEKAVERIRFLNTLPYTSARIIPGKEEQNITTAICGDEVVVMVLNDDEETKPVHIVIKNKNVADAYRADFNILWEKAVKPK